MLEIGITDYYFEHNGVRAYWETIIFRTRKGFFFRQNKAPDPKSDLSFEEQNKRSLYYAGPYGTLAEAEKAAEKRMNGVKSTVHYDCFGKLCPSCGHYTYETVQPLVCARLWCSYTEDGWELRTNEYDRYPGRKPQWLVEQERRIRFPDAVSVFGNNKWLLYILDLKGGPINVS